MGGGYGGIHKKRKQSMWGLLPHWVDECLSKVHDHPELENGTFCGDMACADIIG